MKTLYNTTCFILCLLLVTNACQQEKDTPLTEPQGNGSITLHFNLEPASTSRTGNEGIIQLYYEIKDGKMTSLESPERIPTGRAGDGNTADGGGMADLNVFLVNANDDIVARQSFSGLADVTTQTMNFLDLEPGEYTAYAYANTEGNDWFTMPSDNETSFSNYKNAWLKGLNGSIPSIQNGRMPLTGKLTIPVEGGNTSRTIAMLRPAGKLSITIKNEKTTDAITTSGMTLGNALPHTGYVFKQNNILPKSVENPYYPLANDGTYTIFPASSQLVFETLLYETIAEGFNYTISYKGDADYDFQDNLSGNLQHITGETDIFLIKIKDADLFLKLDLIANDEYQLYLVSALELDEKCYWHLSSNGAQQRGLTNDYYQASLQEMVSNQAVAFSGTKNYNKVTTFKYGGGNDYTIVGEGAAQLTYENGQFIATSNGTHLQFYKSVQTSGETIITPDPFPILVQNEVTNSIVPLTTIHRNQHIKLNIVFR